MNNLRIKMISPEIALAKYNELDVLEINHSKVKAKIALQGAQLLSWQPKNTQQDVLWLSEIEPFQTGVAIRGGIPICHPWFGTDKSLLTAQPVFKRGICWNILPQQMGFVLFWG